MGSLFCLGDSMSDQRVASIADMLGHKTLKVIWNENEYPIRAMDSLSPEEFGRVMGYGKKFSTMTEEELQANSGVPFLKAIDEVIAIIAPEFPQHRITFAEKASLLLKRKYIRKFDLSLEECIAILQFWTANNQKKAVRTVVKPRMKQRRK